MPIRKAVIPAAGLGTRMLPAAKAVPKEMLPVLDRPAIQYVVEEAASAGAINVLLISSPTKRAIEDHFKSSAMLETRLHRSGKRSLLASLDALIEKVKVTSVDQLELRGLGDAVLRARDFVGSEPFLCMLGDTIFDGDLSPSQQLIEAHEKLGGTIVGLEEVPAEKVSRYGIVSGSLIEPGLLELNTFVEKPTIDAAPSRFAIAARYILTPAIFDCFDHANPDARGEIQLTDSLRQLSKREPIHGVVLKSRRHDIGNPVDWLLTNLAFAARDEKLRDAILPTLRQLFRAAIE